MWLKLLTNILNGIHFSKSAGCARTVGGYIVSSPLGSGGMIFVSSARQGATAKLQEPGWGHIQGEDDFRQSSRGGLLYHDELLVFPQNASP